MTGYKFIDSYPLPTQVYGRTAAKNTQSLTYVERKIRDELMDAEWLAPTEEQRRYLIFNGGLQITSTIDARAQALAEEAADAEPDRSGQPSDTVALAAVDPTTGAVRAIVGETIVNGTPIEIGDPVQGPRRARAGSARARRSNPSR